MEKTARGPGGVPERSKDFAHLPLPALRQYRKALTQEEARVSYWRRILQARLDMVRAAENGMPPGHDNLRPVLTEDNVGAGRRALVEVLAIEDIPPLPNLAALWEREPVVGDENHNAGLVQELVSAESQLSAYRLALHRRLSAATGELIARYREEPRLCLSILPLPPEREARAAHGA